MGGVEAVIDDDGSCWLEHAGKDYASITDLMQALRQKYECLRKKLIWEMVKYQNGKFNHGLSLR